MGQPMRSKPCLARPVSTISAGGVVSGRAQHTAHFVCVPQARTRKAVACMPHDITAPPAVHTGSSAVRAAAGSARRLAFAGTYVAADVSLAPSSWACAAARVRGRRVRQLAKSSAGVVRVYHAKRRKQETCQTCASTTFAQSTVQRVCRGRGAARPGSHQRHCPVCSS